MVWGCYLYSYTEVVANGITRGDLPSCFDPANELIEGTLPGMLALIDVIGFAKIMTTEKYGESREQGEHLHQGGVYVDDDNSKARWKIVPKKQRPNESTTKRRRRC